MRRRGAHPARTAWLVVGGLVAFMLAVAACGGGGSSSGGGSEDEALQTLGKGEGALNLVSWPGYVESGGGENPDWVTPFEKKTGCKVNNKEAGTSDEMVQLMKSGQYDGVSASGNASARLWAAHLVAPVNTDLVPNYKTVFADLKEQPYNTFEGTPYGIPHGRGANLLMWNSKSVKPAPTSWNVTLDPNVASKYAGKISQYDDPMSIAEAAVYLKAHETSLGIEDPYELNEEQFEAAVNLLKEQRANVGEYWGEAAKQIQAFGADDVELGTTWQYQYFALKGEGVPVASEPGEPGLPAGRGGDRVVGHLDDQRRSQASQLHVRVDELDHRTEGQRRSRRMVRRGTGPGTRLRRNGKPEFLQRIPRRRTGLLEARLLLGDAAGGMRQRRRQLHGLQPVGQSLDRNQGLGPAVGSDGR